MEWISCVVGSKVKWSNEGVRYYYDICDFCKTGEAPSSVCPTTMAIFLENFYSRPGSQVAANYKSPHQIFQRGLAQIYLISWSRQPFTIRISTQMGGSPCVFNVKEMHWLVEHKKIYNAIFLLSRQSRGLSIDHWQFDRCQCTGRSIDINKSDI